MDRLTQRTIDYEMAEAAGWEAKGDVYWAQGQWVKAIEAFERRIACLSFAERMRSKHGGRRKK